MNSYLEELELNLSRESSHDNSHNCSFASRVIRKYTQNNNKIKEIWVVSCADGLVLLHLHEDMTQSYYIGNHVLPQWVQLSSPPYLPQYHRRTDSGLVTQMRNGALLGYKVVCMFIGDQMFVSPTWTFHIYSSDTSERRVQQVSFPCNCVSHSISNPVFFRWETSLV